MPPSTTFRRRHIPLRRKMSRNQKICRKIVVTSITSIPVLCLFFLTLQLVPTSERSALSSSSPPLPIGECQQQKIVQEKDRIPIDPSTASIFNCHSPHGKCTYFRPYYFFHYCGAGHPYTPIVEDMFHRHRDGSLWEDQPPIVMPHLKLRTNMQLESGKFFDNNINLSMIHIHKCGGSSLVFAFRDLELLNQEQFEIHEDGEEGEWQEEEEEEEEEEEPAEYTYKGTNLIYIHKNGKRGWKKNRRRWLESSKFIDEAVTYQPPHAWDDINHMIMAVVRDPTERFISAVGHVTNTNQNFAVDPGLSDACLRDTVAETLRCFATLVRENDNGFFIDLHFTPMVMEIAFATMGKDVPVAVFDFNDLPTVLKEIGAPPHKKNKDGKQPGYRNHVMMDATVADYDDDVLREVCELYMMDVVFLHQLGRSTRCDAIISS